MIQEVTTEVIDRFFEGHDPMERIVNIECGYMDDAVSIIYRDEDGIKRIKKDEFRPFVWCKNKVAIHMYERFGERKRQVLVNEMNKRGIACKGLEIHNKDGETFERLENGYRIMFYAKRAMSYNDFLSFFKDAGTPIYVQHITKSMKEWGLDGKEFLAVSPVEQYMMASGKRLFKGYDNYDDLVRLVWDIETTGLNSKTNKVTQMGIRTNKGFQKLYSVEGEGVKRVESEVKAICGLFDAIETEKPDVIAGHNIENFDIPFCSARLHEAGTSMEVESSRRCRSRMYKENKLSVLKLGGEMEYYYRTKMWGTTILDSLHAVRRAQASDSNIKSANLKYITKYSRIAKKNRVYIPGDSIQKTWDDKENHYAFNDENGDWYIYDKDYIEPVKEVKTLEDFIKVVQKNNKGEMGLFEDNYVKETAQRMYDEYLESVKRENSSDTFKIHKHNTIKEGYTLVNGEYIAQRYLMDDLWETDKVECRYNECNFLLSKFLPTQFGRVCTMGTAGLWKLIMLAWSYEHDLAVPAFGIKTRYTGGLSRLLMVGRTTDDCYKEDYNSLYPAEIITNYIKTNLDISDGMIKMLEHMLGEREKYKALKGAAANKADELKEKLKLTTNNLEKQKIKEEITKEEENKNKNDKKQLPLKTFCNSFFGGYGNPALFNWGDIDCAEETTCRGRQMLRYMIYFFTNRGYKPIVGDTDGFNLQKPQKYTYTEENPYVGKGLNRNVKKDKKYIEAYADTAEFNDLYLRGKQGLDCEEKIPISINISRKNYIDYFGKNKDGSDDIKLVGNTIKSKKMNYFLEKFMNNAIHYLIHNDGKKFIEYYYEYLEKIYNYRIPLKDIASKGKIKLTIDDYLVSRNELTANGSKKSRQAWYELAIKNGVHVDVGDTIYYINTGTKKGDGDVKRLTHFYQMRDGERVDVTKDIKREWEKYKKEFKMHAGNTPDKQLNLIDFSNQRGNCITYKTTDESGNEIIKSGELFNEDELILNCKLLPLEIVESDEDIYCDDDTEYNVAKYVDQFNNRIKPLTVCFSKAIRDRILVSDPRKRNYFTDEECKLVSGEPFNPSDQDTYEELMTMDRREVAFWVRVNKKPPFVDEMGMDWNKIVADYKELKKQEENAIFQALDEQYLKALDNLKLKDFEDFISTGILPKKLSEVVHMDKDMHVRFNELPNMTPSTGGYVFDDIIIDDEDEDSEEETED